MKGPLLLVGLLALARLGSSTTTTRKATLASSTAKIGKTKTNSTTTSAHAITPPGVFAVIPTSAGQIGVNPVEDDLGPTTTYIGSVHSTDLSLISASDEVTHVRRLILCSSITISEIFSSGLWDTRIILRI